MVKWRPILSSLILESDIRKDVDLYADRQRPYWEKKGGDVVKIEVPAGIVTFKIEEITI